MWVPQIIFFIYCMGPSGLFLRLLYGSPSQISVFAYYMGGPSDQFLRLQGSLRPVSLHMPPPPPRSVVLLTMWGPLSDQFLRSLHVYAGTSGQFLCILYGSPSNLFLCIRYGGRAPSDQFLCLLYGSYPPPPLRSVSLRSMHISPPPPQISFFAYYMGAPSDQFLRILFEGSLIPVSLHTIWGPP